MKDKKVVIFTKAYNAEKTIGRTIESILKQTYTNFQYYILDNGSTDLTENVICEYCKDDNRIIHLHLNKNDPANGSAFVHMLIYSTDAEYLVLCDADDTYSPDFLENMVGFAQENDLDITACGYDKIDGLTGEVVKHRALDKNLVIYDDLFETEFVDYRGFTIYEWGKLFSIPFMKGAKSRKNIVREPRVCNDSLWILNIFRKAERAGIYGKSMYQYYQYPHALSRMNKNIEAHLTSYKDLWLAEKDYLEDFGPLSSRNEDFLYAIYMSLAEEMLGRILTEGMEVDKQLQYLNVMFNDDLWKAMISHKASPEFQNLARRKEFLCEIKSKIEILGEVDGCTETKKKILDSLDVYIRSYDEAI